MHTAEVDLNYTQYHPLSETYISLYPPAATSDDGDEMIKKVEDKPKPPMWFEVEKALEDGTLNRLRNRQSTAPVKPARPLERRPAKPKKEAPRIDTTGLNRRERRKALGIKDTRGKTKPISSVRDQNTPHNGATVVPEVGQDNDSDGGFFED